MRSFCWYQLKGSEDQHLIMVGDLQSWLSLGDVDGLACLPLYFRLEPASITTVHQPLTTTRLPWPTCGHYRVLSGCSHHSIQTLVSLAD